MNYKEETSVDEIDVSTHAHGKLNEMKNMISSIYRLTETMRDEMHERLDKLEKRIG